MFITHGDKVRKHMPIVFGIIAVIVALGLVVTYGPSMFSDSQRGGEDVPTVRGKAIPLAEYERARKDVQDQFVISTGRQMPVTADSQDEWKRQATLRWLMLRKADQLGIRATDEALMRWVASHPIFRNERGQFDPDRYRQFMTLMLSRYSIAESRFLELMRAEIVIGQLRDWIGAAAKVTPQEAQLSYAPLHEAVSIELAQFNMTDNRATITVSDADAKSYFDAQKESFRKPALAKVRYATFTTDAFQKAAKVSETDVQTYFDENRFRFPQATLLQTNITGAVTNIVAAINSNALTVVFAEIRGELTIADTRRRAGDAAQALAVKLVPDSSVKERPNFTKIATDLGATIKETDYFTLQDTIPGVNGRGFNEAAFWLARRPEPPFSDAVEGTDVFYVLEYLDAKPSRIPEFTEVKNDVISRIKEERRYEATLQQGRDALDKLRKLLADGQSFSNACTALQLKIDLYGPFTASDQDFAAPAAPRIQQAAIGMATNSLSEFITTPTGGLFFYLKERRPAAPAAYELDRARMTEQLLIRARRAMFDGWTQTLLSEEQVDFGKPRPHITPSPESEEKSAEPVVPGKS